MYKEKHKNTNRDTTTQMSHGHKGGKIEHQLFLLHRDKVMDYTNTNVSTNTDIENTKESWVQRQVRLSTSCFYYIEIR